MNDKITFRTPFKKQLETLAKKSGMNTSSLLNMIIHDFLNNYDHYYKEKNKLQKKLPGN